ncbi:lanthionine synthetase LanC family protein [Kutzneria sp. 744]|uniref:lanthionine synthetase LanC family protein n=1 Tax=Kutzneria sp. (strain 744) TaxID=345341 RepID=UPI0005B994EE|nr:lanthionine synthetase LanC family protein [Kutzneria sp. 744]
MHPEGAPGDRLLDDGILQLLDGLNLRKHSASVLGALVAAMPRNERLPAVVRTAAKYTAKRCERESMVLPGLHFGQSGAVWALLDAARALADPKLMARAVKLATEIPIVSTNPDVCDGSAGAGLTVLHAWRVTGDLQFLDRAAECARHQDTDQGKYGFGHGIAGIAAFLLDYALVTDDKLCRIKAIRLADALCDGAMWDRTAARWPSGPGESIPLGGWCGDAAGVGSFLVRAWLATGDERYRKVADAAAAAVRADQWTMATASCHGVVENVEFLLDMAEATGDGRHRDWALKTIGTLAWPDDAGLPVLVAALVRMVVPGAQRLWMPPLRPS